jgi:hypothetical protein
MLASAFHLLLLAVPTGLSFAALLRWGSEGRDVRAPARISAGRSRRRAR